MCLITKKQEPTVVQEDKVVYKLMTELSETSAKSVFQKTMYVLGELFTSEFSYIPPTADEYEWSAMDNQAYEFYTTVYGDYKRSVDIRSKLLCVKKGIHSLETVTRAGSCLNMAGWNNLYECTIPKGSLMYSDGDGLLVSNHLIVNRKLSDEEVQQHIPTYRKE